MSERMDVEAWAKVIREWLRSHKIRMAPEGDSYDTFTQDDLDDLADILSQRHDAEVAGLRDDLLAWVDSRIEAEVTHRPDVNRYKRTLSETWAQVRRRIEAISDAEPTALHQRCEALERALREVLQVLDVCQYVGPEDNKLLSHWWDLTLSSARALLAQEGT